MICLQSKRMMRTLLPKKRFKKYLIRPKKGRLEERSPWSTTSLRDSGFPRTSKLCLASPSKKAFCIRIWLHFKKLKLQIFNLCKLVLTSSAYQPNSASTIPCNRDWTTTVRHKKCKQASIKCKRDSVSVKYSMYGINMRMLKVRCISTA